MFHFHINVDNGLIVLDVLRLNLKRKLDNKSHVFFARQMGGFFTLPKRVVNGERIASHSEVFRMNLSETFTA